METPWGRSDSKEILAKGIVSYSTPSHGGIRLSPKRIAQIPATAHNFLDSLEWWEEDCDWVVPYILFKDDIQAHGCYKFIDNLAAAYVIAQRHHPEILALS